MSTAIKTVKLNEEVVKEMNLQTFPSVKAKDLFVKTVLKHTDLLPCEVDALLAISRYASKIPGVCWATVATMVADKNTKYGDRAFRKGVKGLRDKGIVIVHETRRACSGGKGTNIYQLNPEYVANIVPNSSVQVDDSCRVHIADSYRPDAETACPASDETLSQDPKKSFKVYSTNLSKEEYKSYSYMAACAEEQQNQNGQEEKASREEKLGDIYNHEVEKYCRAFGVPEEVIKELKPYFQTDEIITLWKSIKGGLRNIGEKYENNVDEVIEAIRYTVIKYKRREANSFGGYLVGKLKGLISDREQRLAEEYEKRAKQEWIESRRRLYGLDVEDKPESDEEKVRSLYAKFSQYMTDDEAFEAVVEDLVVSKNMKPWDARYLVSSIVGVPSAPEEVWGNGYSHFDHQY